MTNKSSESSTIGVNMFFYVDESGHTGPNLFDPAQPMLYYGVLSSESDIAALAQEAVAKMREKLGVPRLHAAELGNEKLASIVDELLRLQSELGFAFDVFRVAKPDHAIICFFDQVFDQGVNPAVSWTGYWTPLRYVLLARVATLFDEQTAKLAWNARLDTDNTRADATLADVCQILLGRVDTFSDARSRQLIGDALAWAAANPRELYHNATGQNARLQTMPNMVGFQFVMSGIARRLKATGRQASQIVVDQQSQFNKPQRFLATYYGRATGQRHSLGPGMPEADYEGMPTIPIHFASSTANTGLELVDVHLWIFKRFMEGKELAAPLYKIVKSQWHLGHTDEISLRALANRWSAWFERLPEPESADPERLEELRELMLRDEERRLKAVRSLSGAPQSSGSTDPSLLP
ncbi:DUF3800 domain-containing protein [Ralstonia pseudosolanacearum]|uniref:DUF3800 domain-containing protein n=1 Tax=Ralstonia pseudosolanacearum TaxID=1310165 RepID=UPI0018D0B5A2|nr:DUF3800 domain-containing protein [Ralstonia pseudosolanacearum]BEU51373.1 hypothetical protein MAFF211520_16650 [Ralstonia pseudosolanacearum]